MVSLFIPSSNVYGSTAQIYVEQNSLVVIGANGSGKTRFGSQIEKLNLNNVTRISAQRAISMPKKVSTTSKEEAEFMIQSNTMMFNMTGTDEQYMQQQMNNKYTNRWQNNPNTHMLNDYQILMVYLFSLENELAIELRNNVKSNTNISYVESKLDKVIRIWESVLPHRKLEKLSGKLIVKLNNIDFYSYNSSEMSDGERVIFYLISQAICAKPNQIIIIDEPEIHIHKSIISSLFDQIENSRKDCLFLYLTHDLNFASTRINSKKIWIKSYNGSDMWDYQFYENSSSLPEQIFYEILGSRSEILFVEGDVSCLDFAIFQLLYKDYTVKPVGSCEKVIHYVKSFNEQTSFHRIIAKGIIDFDRRSDEEVEKLTSNNIFTLQVCEIENLFLNEECIYALSRKMGKDPVHVFDEVKKNLFDFFTNQLEYQITQVTISILKRDFSKSVDDKSENFASLLVNINQQYNKENAEKIYVNIEREFNEIIQQQDYSGLLKVFNNKGVLASSKLHILCGLSGKNEVVEQIKYIVRNGEDLRLNDSLRSLIQLPSAQ